MFPTGFIWKELKWCQLLLSFLSPALIRNFHPPFTLLLSILVKEIHCSFCHIFAYCLNEWLLWDFVPHYNSFSCALSSNAYGVSLKWVEEEAF